jgi:hypothetical protein
MAMSLDPQHGQHEPLGGGTDITRRNASRPRGRTGHRLRVLGLICFFAFLSLWIFSLFYRGAVVREWSDGFTLIGTMPGGLGALCEYIPAECWSMGIDDGRPENAAELCRSYIKVAAQSFRPVFADHRIQGRWSLDRVCYGWLPSYTSSDDSVSRAFYIRTRTLSIPFWIPMILIAVPTLWSFWRARERSKWGRCRKCLYDLTGNVSGICPECGTPIPEQVRMEVESNKAKDG